MQAFFLIVVLNLTPPGAHAGATSREEPAAKMQAAPRVGSCVAFSPYVGNFDPDTGPHPGRADIDRLLDGVIAQTSARCILTYGVLNGLDYIFESARRRGIEVVAIIWLDSDPIVNSQSISSGIQNAKRYPDVIRRLSCGSEVRTRRGVTAAEPVIRDCLTRLRAAGVTQPITSIDTWWAWCNERDPCQSWRLADDVDWIGINVYSWWENKFSGLFPCTTAAQSADFTVARYQVVAARYRPKTTIVTEYGWPRGPDGYTETNTYTGQRCGVASAANQQLVLETTAARFELLGVTAIAFESYPQPWKARREGPVGPNWNFLTVPAPPPPGPTIPGVPRNLAASASGASVQLSWEGPSTGATPTGYVIEVGSSAGLTNLARVLTGSQTTFAGTGAAAGVYFVRVRALNGDGESAPSNEVRLVVGACAAVPASVAGLRLIASVGRRVSLGWDAAAGATTYVIEAGSSPGASNIIVQDLASGATSVVADGVPPGLYYVRVRASNACGSGPASNELELALQ